MMRHNARSPSVIAERAPSEHNKRRVAGPRDDRRMTLHGSYADATPKSE